ITFLKCSNSSEPIRFVMERSQHSSGIMLPMRWLGSTLNNEADFIRHVISHRGIDGCQSGDPRRQELHQRETLPLAIGRIYVVRRAPKQLFILLSLKKSFDYHDAALEG